MGKLLGLAITLGVGLASGQAGFSFSQAGEIVLPGAISEPSVADINKDRIQDVLVRTGDQVMCFLGQGEGRFRDPVVTALASYAQLIDIDVDGNLDLAGGDRILFGTGDCRFAREVAGPPTASYADVNEDGIPDGLSYQSSPRQMTIQFGNGDGTFRAGPVTAIPLGTFPRIYPDLTGDGHVDAVMGWRQLAFGIPPSVSGGTSIIPGDGAGHFDFSRAVLLYSDIRYPSVADFNGDGKPDLHHTGEFDNSGFLVMLTTGPAQYRSAVSLSVGTCVNDLETYYGGCDYQPVVGDFDQDGKVDLIYSAYEPASLGWRTVFSAGRGDGSFQNPAFLGLPGILIGGDWNNDGRPDVASWDGNRVVFYLNRAAALPVAVSSASASMATSPGSLATLYGAAFPASTAAASSLSNLPTSLGGLELFVRDAKGDRRPAPLLYVSPTQVNFQVPEGSAIGTGQVEAKVNGAYTSIGVIEVRDAAPALFSAVSAFPKAPTVVTFYGTGFRGANTSNVQVVIQGTAYTPGSVRPVAGMTGVDAIEVPIFDNPSWVFPGIPYGGGAVVFRGTLTNLVHTGLPH